MSSFAHQALVYVRNILIPPGMSNTIGSILKGLETSHVRPLKCITNSTGNPRHELSQFRVPEKERTREIKKEETPAVGPMSYLTT